jgi:hypothetical protein
MIQLFSFNMGLKLQKLNKVSPMVLPGSENFGFDFPLRQSCQLPGNVWNLSRGDYGNILSTRSLRLQDVDWIILLVDFALFQLVLFQPCPVYVFLGPLSSPPDS